MTHLQKYVEYITNTGGVTPDQFDDDWEPIGPMVRADLKREDLAHEVEGKLVLVAKEEV